MPKNIVICSDGTGNTAIKGRGTNVFKLFEALDQNGHRTDPEKMPQVAIYDDGVGTERFKPLKILGGAAGWGLSANVKQLYKELSRIYDPGDHIFLFGFSRGAFTVRTLAGMIVRCGILNGSSLPTAAALERAVADTYRAYRVLGGYDSHLTRLASVVLGRPDPDRTLATLHRDYEFHPKGPIRFIGVWDTVDAVGLPIIGDWFNRWIYQFKFSTLTLSPDVERACHALSIDDERVSFKPVLWEVRSEADRKRIEQVWFAGAHSNVGGGYPKQGLSLVALVWMLRQAGAEPACLRIQPLDLEIFDGHSTVDDQLYDPRAGLGIFYRWAPRDIDALCQKNHVPPKLHLSVVERVAHGTDDYSPGNLPANAEVVITPMGQPAADEAAGMRADAAGRALGAALAMPTRLLDQVRKPIAVGVGSYRLFLLSWLALAAGLVGVMAESQEPLPSIPTILKSVATLGGQVASLQYGALGETLCTVLVSRWRWTMLASLVGFVFAWIFSNMADSRMSAVFSGFWHQHQEDLRTALKQARIEATAAKEGLR